jgi:EAL domain-containing protein (putative c-di-GMP-specific phosphodiesterase class I)/signal transduction histidine kinase
MEGKGEGRRRQPPETPPRTRQARPLKAALVGLVIACVGCATLAASVGAAWREGHDGAPAAGLPAHRLIVALEIDLLAGAVALAVGLCLAARFQRRADAALGAIMDALADLAADPDPHRVAPLAVEGELAPLAQLYNDSLAALSRRENQVTLHSLAQVEKSRRAELAMLRQDLAAPLAAATSWAKDLAPEAPCPEVARRDRRIAQALGRTGASLLATLDDIAQRAHNSPNGVQVNATAVDVCELTQDVCTLLWTQAAAKGLDLAVYVDPKTPQFIQSDAVRLRQIVGGLVSSALAVTAEGGVLIEVEPDSATSIRISIHDTGSALARTPTSATSSEPPSSGASGETDARLGDPDGALPARMALYRQMVKAMGGAFAAQPPRDRGATFAFRLPAARVEAVAPWAGAAPPRPSEGAKDAAAPPPRVLVAVRGPCTRRALSRYLSRAGLTAGVYEGEPPPAGTRLVIADAAGLLALGPLELPIARLAADDDLAGLETWSGPAPVAILSQPIYRAELEALLRKVNGGQPLRSEPRPRSPGLAGLDGPGATPLSDDERALLADLDRAAERDQFSLAYQPQVEREGERILGVEALLRWTHPTRGPVSPGVFIPLAEKAGRIAEVTAWVIDRVLAETQYLSGLQVSFNASALEFADEGFVDRLLAAVARTGYDARRLEVEITETAILRHETPVLESMKRLHAVGIGVALDDFGAGYSSLSHLRRYPFDKLKIDREFITDCSRDMESATVVHAVVSIGRALGMKVIAEGVETETQRNFLRIAGVYAMQGFLFGKPMPIDDLAPLIGAARAKARG